jgi:MHS family proline/betaine transporter-like MFS transporter
MTSGTLNNLILAECIFIIFAICYQGALTVGVMGLVPTAVRYSVMAVSYNMANSLFGGTAPLVTNYIGVVTGDKAGLGYCLMFGAFLALTATVKMREADQIAVSYFQHPDLIMEQEVFST